MFEDLAAAIAELEPPANNESLAAALWLRDRFEAKLTIGIADFDRAGLWDLDSASSATAWLRQHGITGGAAASLVRTGRRLGGAPTLAKAWFEGEMSGGQVQAIVAQLNDDVAPLFGEHEAELVPVLVGLSVRETAIVMQQWRAKADALLEGDEPNEPERTLHVSRTFGGRAELKGSFDTDTASTIDEALRVASTEDDEATGVRMPATRRADALTAVCRYFLDHQEITSTGGRHRPHVNIVVRWSDLDGDVVGHTPEGARLDAASIRTMLCDANVHRVVTDGDSTILDYGRSTRTAPPALFAALALRDGHCRLVEGCDRPPSWCEAHHVIPWEDEGPTSLDNLVLACSHHHHVAHRRRWQQWLEPDGTYTVLTADGRRWTTYPRGPVALTLAG